MGLLKKAVLKEEITCYHNDTGFSINSALIFPFFLHVSPEKT